MGMFDPDEQEDIRRDEERRKDAEIAALREVQDAALLDCQPKSKEDAVMVSAKWRDAVKAAAERAPRPLGWLLAQPGGDGGEGENK